MNSIINCGPRGRATEMGLARLIHHNPQALNHMLGYRQSGYKSGAYSVDAIQSATWDVTGTL